MTVAAQQESKGQLIGPDWGITLSEAVVKKGLRELCPGLHFDMGNKLAGATFAMNTPNREQINGTRQGVFYDGRYICAMDRGVLPEVKLWDVEDGIVEIPMVELDRYDDSMVLYYEILPTDPYYHIGLTKAMAKDDNWVWDEGKKKLFRHTCLRQGKVRGRVMRVGWRHTFENLLRARVPGITRESLAEKFKVDMNKFPMGTPDEIDAALNEE